MVYHRSEGSGSRLDMTANSSPSSSQPAARNVFRNDGSFLEMFKKMQGGTAETANALGPESSTSKSQSQGPVASSAPENRTARGSDGSSSGSVTKKPQPVVGKRRGGRVLPTGMVKKKKTDDDDDEDKPKDAWSLYMAEVRRYKETSCEEDGKTRPLVK